MMRRVIGWSRTVFVSLLLWAASPSLGETVRASDVVLLVGDQHAAAQAPRMARSAVRRRVARAAPRFTRPRLWKRPRAHDRRSQYATPRL
ncbi:MAG: hypothetical protein ABW321_16670, partial [Polyangiales bacterium]